MIGSENASSDKAFSDVKILDFTQVFAGPVGTHQFALQGADIIKVEPRGGEDIRRSALGDEWSARGLAPSFMAFNANKRGLTLDLKKPAAVEIVKRLAAEADVVWENFRPGVMDRLGIGYDVLAELNPQLIYCSVSGFGTTGPERATATFDGKIQAMSGLMSLTGDPSGGPMRAGIALADLAAGLTAAFAVSTALHQRSRTGRGQFVDVAMFDSMLSLMSDQIAEYTVLGELRQQAGNLSVTRKPTADRFRCGAGFLVLAVLSDRQFESLLRTLGRADAIDDPKYADWPARTANTVALRALIEGAMDGGDPRDWERRLTDADVPCASILTIAEAIDHPQLEHRNLIQTVDTAYGPVTLAGAGFELRHGTGGIERSAPEVGEHTDEILTGAGFSESEIAQLRADDVV